MNADQIAEILPALREVLAGAPDTCATLETTGNAGKWLQVIDKTVNAAYPYPESPDERASRLGLSSSLPTLVAWEAGTYATFEFPQFDVDTVAQWIDAYFVQVLGCPEGEYHLDVTLEKL